MASSSESGHAINVANMDKLISYGIGFKEDYNPSREALKLASLQEISLNGKNAIDKVYEMFSAYTIAVGARKTAFAPLSQLVTKVINSLRATETLDHTDRSATTFVRKIQGRRAKPKRTEEEREADAAASSPL